MKIHKKLKTGILKDVDNPRMPEYVPHISLGEFSSEDELKKAIKDVKKRKICIKNRVDKIYLISINSKRETVKREVFKLR
jgi:2'-5' RNA ligase